MELCRRHGVHPNTIRLWKEKYAGLESSDLARLKQLEAENAQMQRIIARQTIEIDALRTLIEKSGWVSHSAKRRWERCKNWACHSDAHVLSSGNHGERYRTANAKSSRRPLRNVCEKLPMSARDLAGGDFSSWCAGKFRSVSFDFGEFIET